jgi:hypothetical protein
MTVFIGCVKNKKSYKTHATDLYDSTFFTKCLQYASSLTSDNIYILSAKYGLVQLNDVIEPYDKTLNNMSKKERLEWAHMVYNQICNTSIDFNDKTVWLCGSKYRTDLLKYFPNSECPLEGMGIGKQLSFMTKKLQNTTTTNFQTTLNEEELW